MEVKIIHFDTHGDNRGKLIALEENKDIPFNIRRVYYIFDTLQDVHRGFHAHKNLEQVLVCVNGSCKILLDDGTEKTIVELRSPEDGLYINHNMWREMYDFSEDAVLLVLASLPYDESDYIRNYQDFISYLNDGRKE